MWRLWGRSAAAGAGAAGARGDGDGADADRFTLAHLLSLHGTLVRLRGAPPSAASDEVIVDTVKQLSELMVYGDKHEDAGFFELFCEKGLLRTLVELFREPSRGSEVRVQIIQSLSVLLINISAPSSLFYLLSNNHVNDLIASRVDGADEELLAYYVSFLKTLSLSINPGTVHFFLQSAVAVRRSGGGGGGGGGAPSSAPDSPLRPGTPDARPSAAAVAGAVKGGDAAPARSAAPPAASLPLYTEALRYVHHSDSMVRTTVRTLTLNVYAVRDAGVRGYLNAPGPHYAYHGQLAQHVRAAVLRMSGLVAALGGGVGGPGGQPPPPPQQQQQQQQPSSQHAGHAGHAGMAALTTHDWVALCGARPCAPDRGGAHAGEGDVPAAVAGGAAGSRHRSCCTCPACGCKERGGDEAARRNPDGCPPPRTPPLPRVRFPAYPITTGDIGAHGTSISTFVNGSYYQPEEPSRGGGGGGGGSSSGGTRSAGSAQSLSSMASLGGGGNASSPWGASAGGGSAGSDPATPAGGAGGGDNARRRELQDSLEEQLSELVTTLLYCQDILAVGQRELDDATAAAASGGGGGGGGRPAAATAAESFLPVSNRLCDALLDAVVRPLLLHSLAAAAYPHRIPPGGEFIPSEQPGAGSHHDHGRGGGPPLAAASGAGSGSGGGVDERPAFFGGAAHWYRAGQPPAAVSAGGAAAAIKWTVPFPALVPAAAAAAAASGPGGGSDPEAANNPFLQQQQFPAPAAAGGATARLTSAQPPPPAAAPPAASPPLGGVVNPGLPAAATSPIIIDPCLALCVLLHMSKTLTYSRFTSAVQAAVLCDRLSVPSPLLGELPMSAYWQLLGLQQQEAMEGGGGVEAAAAAAAAAARAMAVSTYPALAVAPVHPAFLQMARRQQKQAAKRRRGGGGAARSGALLGAAATAGTRFQSGKRGLGVLAGLRSHAASASAAKPADSGGDRVVAVDTTLAEVYGELEALAVAASDDARAPTTAAGAAAPATAPTAVSDAGHGCASEDDEPDAGHDDDDADADDDTPELSPPFTYSGQPSAFGLREVLLGLVQSPDSRLAAASAGFLLAFSRLEHISRPLLAAAGLVTSPPQLSPPLGNAGCPTPQVGASRDHGEGAPSGSVARDDGSASCGTAAVCGPSCSEQRRAWEVVGALTVSLCRMPAAPRQHARFLCALLLRLLALPPSSCGGCSLLDEFAAACGACVAALARAMAARLHAARASSTANEYLPLLHVLELVCEGRLKAACPAMPDAVSIACDRRGVTMAAIDRDFCGECDTALAPPLPEAAAAAAGGAMAAEQVALLNHARKLLRQTAQAAVLHPSATALSGGGGGGGGAGEPGAGDDCASSPASVVLDDVAVLLTPSRLGGGASLGSIAQLASSVCLGGATGASAEPSFQSIAETLVALRGILAAAHVAAAQPSTATAPWRTACDTVHSLLTLCRLPRSAPPRVAAGPLAVLTSHIPLRLAHQQHASDDGSVPPAAAGAGEALAPPLWDPRGKSLCLDPPLRVIAPPTDSIRPGGSFEMALVTWCSSTAYPLVLGLSHPPIGPAVGDGGGAPAAAAGGSGADGPAAAADSDALDASASAELAPLTAALLAAAAAAPPGSTAGGAAAAGGPPPAKATTAAAPSRVAVVLGKCYLVLAQLPSAPAAARGAEPAGAPPAPKAHAASVVPLHFAFASVPRAAPHVVDVRFLTRTPVALSKQVAVTTAAETMALEVGGVTLVFESAELAAALAAHVEAVRTHVLGAKAAAVAALCGSSGSGRPA